MRPRSVAILFVVVAALAAFVWFVERDLPGSEERAERARRVFSFEASELSEIAWSQAGTRLALRRDLALPDPVWALTEPLSARANSAEVDALVATLSALEKQRTLEEGEPEQLGLTPPRGEIEVAGGRLLIGGEIPASSSMIVAPGPTGPFHVVDKGLWKTLSKPVDEWRDRRVYPGERRSIERVTLERDLGRLVLARRGGDFWIEEPIQDLADEGTVSRLLGALVDLEVAEFLDAAPGDVDPEALPPAGGAIEIGEGSEPAWRLELGRLVGAPDDELPATVTARAEGHLLALGVSLDGALARPVDEWRSLDWAGLEVYEVGAFEVSDAEGTTSFRREESEWVRDGVDVEFNPVSDLLHTIAGAKAEALDAAEGMLGEPVLSMTLEIGEETRRLEVWAPAGDRIAVRASHRSASLWLTGEQGRALASAVAAARSAAPVEADSADGLESGENAARPAVE